MVVEPDNLYNSVHNAATIMYGDAGIQVAIGNVLERFRCIAMKVGNKRI